MRAKHKINRDNRRKVKKCKEAVRRNLEQWAQNQKILLALDPVPRDELN